MMHYDYFGTYPYKEAVYDDVVEWLKENPDIMVEFANSQRDYAISMLVDLLYSDDSVTGGGSGSYWCNRWKAEECLCHNSGIIKEAYDMGCIFKDDLFEPEYLDVAIRLYLLPQTVSDVYEDIDDGSILEDELAEYVDIERKILE